jgi:DNA repair exonuclease SbcCD ATPase subunit
MNIDLENEPPLDYEHMLGEIRHTRQFLGSVSSKMKGEAREQYEVLLGAIDEHFEKFQVEFPKLKQTLGDKYQELVERQNQVQQQYDELHKQFDAVQAQIDAGELPNVAEAKEKPVDPQLGGSHRDEILGLLKSIELDDLDATAAAWQDWDLEGRWIEHTDLQP